MRPMYTGNLRRIPKATNCPHSLDGPMPKPAASIPAPVHHRPFHHRLLLAFLLSDLLLGLSLGIGVLGYHFTAGLNWVDALLNAAMILTGMGPVDVLPTPGAKVFASAYALFSGVVFHLRTGILPSPIFHRVLHRFHLEHGAVD